MIVGVTGHRPKSIGVPYDADLIANPIFRYVMGKTKDAFDVLKPDLVITGMALGYDQWVAEGCIILGIPFAAYIPFDGQESKWPAKAQKHYIELMLQAKTIRVVSPGSYSPAKMHIRNHAIVDDSDAIVACYGGGTGGTEKCVRYAIQSKRALTIINPIEAHNAES